MKKFEINVEKLQSMSVYPGEVCAVEVQPGETIWCKGRRFNWDKPVVCMVDRLGGTAGRTTCTMVRQVLECSLGDWGQDYTEPDCKARKIARKLGCRTVKVPGGIPPLTIEGTIAIPDFSMSGTNWYIVPEDVICHVDNLRVHFLGAEEA